MTTEKTTLQDIKMAINNINGKFVKSLINLESRISNKCELVICKKSINANLALTKNVISILQVIEKSNAYSFFASHSKQKMRFKQELQKMSVVLSVHGNVRE